MAHTVAMAPTNTDILKNPPPPTLAANSSLALRIAHLDEDTAKAVTALLRDAQYQSTQLASIFKESGVFTLPPSNKAIDTWRETHGVEMPA